MLPLHQRKQQHGAQKNLKATTNFYEKRPPIITWSKKHTSKQVVIIEHALEKKYFAAAKVWS